MRLAACILAIGLLSSGVARAQAVDVSAEMKKVEGKWHIVHRAYTPSKATARLEQVVTNLGSKVEINDGKMAALDPDKPGVHLKVEFDHGAKPKSVDVKVPGKDKEVFLGIYRIEGDILSIAISPDDTRPKTFGDKDEYILLVLKKIPK